MAEQIKNNGFFQFSADGMSADDLRKQMLEGKGEAALLGAMEEALDLYAFMYTLPGVLVASQQRELQRLEKLPGDKGPRVDALKASMAQAAKLQATLRTGRTRVDRAIASIAETDDVLHGFVSGADLQPCTGYAVRLVAADGKTRYSAVTGADGYFTMTIRAATKDETRVPGQQDVASKALLDELLRLFGAGSASSPAEVKAAAGTRTKEPLAKEVPEQPKQLASVEILAPGGDVVLQDPMPVDLNGGTVYREYVVVGQAGETAPGRYVGNSARFELHDAQKLTKQCNFDLIRASHKVFFNSTAEAERAGYDYCAYCFGKKKSKR